MFWPGPLSELRFLPGVFAVLTVVRGGRTPGHQVMNQEPRHSPSARAVSRETPVMGGLAANVQIGTDA